MIADSPNALLLPKPLNIGGCDEEGDVRDAPGTDGSVVKVEESGDISIREFLRLDYDTLRSEFSNSPPVTLDKVAPELLLQENLKSVPSTIFTTIRGKMSSAFSTKPMNEQACQSQTTRRVLKKANKHFAVPKSLDLLTTRDVHKNEADMTSGSVKSTSRNPTLSFGKSSEGSSPLSLISAPQIPRKESEWNRSSIASMDSSSSRLSPCSPSSFSLENTRQGQPDQADNCVLAQTSNTAPVQEMHEASSSLNGLIENSSLGRQTSPSSTSSTDTCPKKQTSVPATKTVDTGEKDETSISAKHTAPNSEQILKAAYSNPTNSLRPVTSISDAPQNITRMKNGASEGTIPSLPSSLPLLQIPRKRVGSGSSKVAQNDNLLQDSGQDGRGGKESNMKRKGKGKGKGKENGVEMDTEKAIELEEYPKENIVAYKVSVHHSKSQLRLSHNQRSTSFENRLVRNEFYIVKPTFDAPIPVIHGLGTRQIYGVGFMKAFVQNALRRAACLQG